MGVMGVDGDPGEEAEPKSRDLRLETGD